MTVGRDLVARHAQVVLAEAELNVEGDAVVVGATRRAADTASARVTRHAIRIAVAEGMRTVVDEADTAHAVAARAAFCVRHARIDARRVNADLVGRAAAVVVAHAAHRRDVDARAVAAGLTRRAASGRTRCGAGAVQADAIGPAFMVELTDGTLRTAYAIDARVSSTTRVGGIACAFAVGAKEWKVECALAVATDEAVRTILAANARAHFGAWHFHRTEAFAARAHGSLRAVGVGGTLVDATERRAMLCACALEVAATDGTLRRRDHAAANAVARIASGLIAVVAVLRASGTADRDRTQGKEPQTKFQRLDAMGRHGSSHMGVFLKG